MHLPESIGYITRKLERALKQIPHILLYIQSCYITRKLERALKHNFTLINPAMLASYITRKLERALKRETEV